MNARADARAHTHTDTHTPQKLLHRKIKDKHYPSSLYCLCTRTFIYRILFFSLMFSVAAYFSPLPCELRGRQRLQGGGKATFLSGEGEQKPPLVPHPKSFPTYHLRRPCGRPSGKRLSHRLPLTPPALSGVREQRAHPANTQNDLGVRTREWKQAGKAFDK